MSPWNDGAVNEVLKKPGTSYQYQCSFLTTLPGEVRNNVYRQLMSKEGAEIHIVHVSGRGMVHSECISRNSQECMLKCWTPHQLSRLARGRPAQNDPLPFCAHHSFIANVMLSCRLIYCEAITLFYGHYKLSFQNMTDISAFKLAIRPFAFRAITRLHIMETFNQHNTTFESFLGLDRRSWVPTATYGTRTTEAKWSLMVRLIRIITSLRHLEVDFYTPRVIPAFRPRLSNSSNNDDEGADEAEMMRDLDPYIKALGIICGAVVRVGVHWDELPDFEYEIDEDYFMGDFRVDFYEYEKKDPQQE